MKFDLSALIPQKQKEVGEWLGDRDLNSLSEIEQRTLIQHLTAAQKWKRGDIQRLIGLEGMRRFLGYGKELPFGFDSIEQWKAFQKKLMEGLAAAGVPIHDPRVKVVLQGSAVLGKSHKSKNGTPFRWQGNPKAAEKDYRRPSDFDIAVLVNESLFDTFLERRARSLEEGGSTEESRRARDLKRILKEGRLASHDQDAELQRHHQNLRNIYGQRPIQISIMRPGCYLIPDTAETMAISAEILRGEPKQSGTGN